MQQIQPEAVQERLLALKDRDVYVCIEMTTGAYAALRGSSKFTASTFMKNGTIRFSQGSIAGTNPYRVGLKTETGWVYTEGLTHWDPNETERLILAGHDEEGRLIVGMMLGREPF